MAESNSTSESPTRAAAIVRRIGMAGATEHGEHVALEVEFDEGPAITLLFPFGMFQKLMLALMTAGDQARQAQVERLGSDASVIAHAGNWSFLPTGHQLGRAEAPDGSDVILMRLKKAQLSIIDVMLAYESAEALGVDLLKEVRKGPHDRRRPS